MEAWIYVNRMGQQKRKRTSRRHQTADSHVTACLIDSLTCIIPEILAALMVEDLARAMACSKQLFVFCSADPRFQPWIPPPTVYASQCGPLYSLAPTTWCNVKAYGQWCRWQRARIVLLLSQYSRPTHKGKQETWAMLRELRSEWDGWAAMSPLLTHRSDCRGTMNTSWVRNFMIYNRSSRAGGSAPFVWRRNPFVGGVAW